MTYNEIIEIVKLSDRAHNDNPNWETAADFAGSMGYLGYMIENMSNQFPEVEQYLQQRVAYLKMLSGE
jgi:hypothetical protein